MQNKKRHEEILESELESEQVVECWNEDSIIFGYTTSIYGPRLTVSGKKTFLEVYKSAVRKGFFNEFIRPVAKVVLFLDLDDKDMPLDSTIEDIKGLVNCFFSGFRVQFIVTDATGTGKFSKHMLIRLYKDDKEYVFTNVGQVLLFVREHLNLRGVDLNVYKPGGCLLRSYGAAKEKVGRKLTLDTTYTGPSTTVALIDHFVQWPGELGEDISSFITNKNKQQFFQEGLYNQNMQPVKEVEAESEGSITSYFVRILEGFKFKYKKIYKASERELGKGVLVLYIDVDPLDACPYNIHHKSNKTYLQLTVLKACLKCHGCRLKPGNNVLELELATVLSTDEIFILFRGQIHKQRLIDNSYHLFLSKDPQAEVPVYDADEESIKARVGSPESLRELLGTEELDEDSYHTLNAQSYSVVSSDKSFSVAFKRDRHITNCQNELKSFNKNFIDVKIFNNLTIINTVNKYVIEKQNIPIAGLEDFWNKNKYDDLVYDKGYFLKSKLQADLHLENSFLRVFMATPTPVLFSRFLTIVFGGRGIVFGDCLYLANTYNVYVEYNKEATLGMLAYLGEQLLKGLDAANVLCKANNSNIEEKDGLYNKYLAMRFSLQSPGFLKSCISVLYPFLRDEVKGLGFNTNFNLLPLKDGAYDSELNRVRDIELSDLVTITLPYSKKDLIYSDNTVLAMKFLENLFKNQEEVQYVINELRIILFNKMNDKIYFLIGDGANGKTTFINILRIALNNLVGDLPVEAISNIRASGLNPFIVNLRHCRIGIVAEYGAQTLQVDIIKRLAGCETITVRSLYANPITFPFNTRLMLVANNLPKFSATVDYALERRMRYIYFAKNLSYPKNIKHPIDLRSNMVVNCISLGLLQLLLQNKIEENLTMPTSFVRYSSYAIGELRGFVRFLDNNIKESSDEFITFFEIYCLYTELPVEHTSKDVTKKPEYSAKYKEFKAYIKNKYNIEESHTRVNNKLVRVFKKLRIELDPNSYN